MIIGGHQTKSVHNVNKSNINMKSNKDEEELKTSTLAALLKEKPRRGRPRHSVSRQNVYIALTKQQKRKLKQLASQLPDAIVRADVPDIAVTVLTVRLEALHRAVADRNRPIPEGVTDFESLFLLWDLPLEKIVEGDASWTSIRLSPQQTLELGRAHGTLNAAFGATRSQTFSLALALLEQYLEDYPLEKELHNLDELRSIISRNYL